MQVLVSPYSRVQHVTHAIHSKYAVDVMPVKVLVMAVAAHSIEMQAPGDRGSCWNGELYPLLSEDVDGVSIHPYLHLTDPKTGGGPLQPGVPARTSGEGPTGWYNDSSVQRRNADVIGSDAGLEALFGVPFVLATAAAGDVGTKTKLPDRLSMIVTEQVTAQHCRHRTYSLTHPHEQSRSTISINFHEAVSSTPVLTAC